MRSLEEIKHANELATATPERVEQIKIEDAIATAVGIGFRAGVQAEAAGRSAGFKLIEMGNAVGRALEDARNSLGFAPPSGS